MVKWKEPNYILLGAIVLVSFFVVFAIQVHSVDTDPDDPQKGVLVLATDVGPEDVTSISDTHEEPLKFYKEDAWNASFGVLPPLGDNTTSTYQNWTYTITLVSPDLTIEVHQAQFLWYNDTTGRVYCQPFALEGDGVYLLIITAICYGSETTFCDSMRIVVDFDDDSQWSTLPEAV